MSDTRIDRWDEAAAKIIGSSFVEFLLSDLGKYEIHLVSVVGKEIRATARVRSLRAACPDCGEFSGEVHSRYWRCVRDLLPVGWTLTLRIHARRFRCRTENCSQRIFAERLHGVAANARRSERLSEVLGAVALHVGGLPGVRVAELYGLRYSRDTLLRAARSVPMRTVDAVRVLGVDDFAYRRGRKYGTILYDCERRSVVDLLPDRSAESLADWLRNHPGVEVISRDRGGTYAEGARTGAPSAMQVADRFHLIKNLGDCVERLAQRVGIPPIAADDPEEPAKPAREEMPPARAAAAKAATLARRLERQRVIRELRGQGVSVRAIAQQLRLNRKTVRRYLYDERVPDNLRPRRPGIVDPYDDYLRRRWQEGCHNGNQLYGEIKAMGYTGSASQLRAYLRPWRTGVPRRRRSRATVVTPGQFRRLCLIDAGNRSPEEVQLLEKVTAALPQLAQGARLVEDFARIVRQHQPEDLDAFLKRAAAAGREFASFANSLAKDLDAVRNGITQPWSQGPVEGAINRLKTLKRAMYGRGNNDLLRRRVLFGKAG